MRHTGQDLRSGSAHPGSGSLVSMNIHQFWQAWISNCLLVMSTKAYLAYCTLRKYSHILQCTTQHEERQKAKTIECLPLPKPLPCIRWRGRQHGELGSLVAALTKQQMQLHAQIAKQLPKLGCPLAGVLLVLRLSRGSRLGRRGGSRCAYLAAGVGLKKNAG
eukprot:6195478-Amphidinium_carterae.1